MLIGLINTNISSAASNLEILDDKIFSQKLEYIHRNPVEAGFVEQEEDWLYSSARNFYG
jgi:hypothetical protein